jgi:hypothetical protein
LFALKIILVNREREKEEKKRKKKKGFFLIIYQRGMCKSFSKKGKGSVFKYLHQ